jgi:hypothetical protein
MDVPGPTDPVEPQLDADPAWKTLSLVNDWLKHAETKSPTRKKRSAPRSRRQQTRDSRRTGGRRPAMTPCAEPLRKAAPPSARREGWVRACPTPRHAHARRPIPPNVPLRLQERHQRHCHPGTVCSKAVQSRLGRIGEGTTDGFTYPTASAGSRLDC